MTASFDVLFRPATELAALIRRRSLSPVEVVASMIAAMEASQGDLNAFVTIAAEQALEAAQQAEAACLAGGELGPLHGVPFIVKDLTPTAGVVTTYGSRTRATHVPRADAVAVERLKAAGAILVGKTTTPEYGHKPFTDAPLFGVTRNPWAADRTCGGSSGGTAAAIAAGLGPLGLGTDGGGSVRIPASCCGVVGLKPSLGRVPHVEAADTFNNLSHVGPMTRSVADARLVFAAIAGPHRNDVLSWMTVASRRAGDDLRGMRVGWLPNVGAHGVDAEVLGAAQRVADRFAAMGADVEPLWLDFVALEPAFLTIMRTGLFARLGHLLDERRGDLDESLAETIELGRAIPARDLHGAMEARTEAFRSLQASFERFDVLVSPTLTLPALEITHGAFDPVTIDGRAYPNVRAAWYPYTYVFNLTGHPAISVPCGWTSGGLPIGAQIAGPWGSEELLLDLAAAWEQAAPWHDRRPPTPWRSPPA